MTLPPVPADRQVYRDRDGDLYIPASDYAILPDTPTQWIVLFMNGKFDLVKPDSPALRQFGPYEAVTLELF